ncbi:inositol monophosphatase [Streptomyces litmocidini]|uniref:inositol monophosphatase family protein n=1 Tax=Streptomyces litmocidini TaxID=67318 RepID=UPI00167C6846|nr:inositol monophosphatase [Streptomyces litmocidini]GGU80557.1 inositol monophosphatase [Streptomyces litmocidini]
MTDYLPWLDTVLDRADELALRYAGSGGAVEVVGVKAEDRNQVSTAADHAIGEMIVAELARDFPADSVIEEESGVRAASGPVTWIIDPLDGTSNYAAGSPLYGAMLAAVDDRGLLAAGITLPALGRRYLAQRGRGAFRDGVPFRTPACTGLEDRLVAYGMDKAGPERMAEDARLMTAIAAQCLGTRASNSVFDAALVIDGAYAGYVHRSCRIWDVAAPACVLSESGGTHGDLGGRPLDFRDPLLKVDLVYEVILAADGAREPLAALGRQVGAAG